MASPVTFPSPSASPSHTSMPFPSPTSNHKPNPHPYAIKTTSTGVLSRSNSNSHNTHAAKNSYVPESPRNGSRSRSRHDSESDSDTGGSKSRYRGHRYSRSLTGDEMAPAPRPASANGGSMEDGKGDRPSRQRTDSMRSTSSTEESGSSEHPPLMRHSRSDSGRVRNLVTSWENESHKRESTTSSDRSRSRTSSVSDDHGGIGHLRVHTTGDSAVDLDRTPGTIRHSEFDGGSVRRAHSKSTPKANGTNHRPPSETSTNGQEPTMEELLAATSAEDENDLSWGARAWLADAPGVTVKRLSPPPPDPQQPIGIGLKPKQNGSTRSVRKKSRIQDDERGRTIASTRKKSGEGRRVVTAIFSPSKEDGGEGESAQAGEVPGTGSPPSPVKEDDLENKSQGVEDAPPSYPGKRSVDPDIIDAVKSNVALKDLAVVAAEQVPDMYPEEIEFPRGDVEGPSSTNVTPPPALSEPQPPPGLFVHPSTFGSSPASSPAELHPATPTPLTEQFGAAASNEVDHSAEVSTVPTFSDTIVQATAVEHALAEHARLRALLAAFGKRLEEVEKKVGDMKVTPPPPAADSAKPESAKASSILWSRAILARAMSIISSTSSRIGARDSSSNSEPNSVRALPGYVFLVSLGVCAVVAKVVWKEVGRRSRR